uniref:Endoplasmic reticulum vesicle transporter N-terminal domain-containing protein n=1 Tax=Bartheletia paradoxa TaxID=669517 RepID=A0A2D0XHU9_9BASI|nr:hypothetical protein SPAR05704 [Bartheletia paradoxa]
MDVSSSGLLRELDSLPALRSFDAFPKTQSTYRTRSTTGGLTTLFVILALFLLTLNDLNEYLYGEATYEFGVDTEVGKQLQINVDITVAMPCHFLTVDVRDAVGDRLHISDEFRKDPTTFDVGEAQRLQTLSLSETSASNIIRDASSGWFSRNPSFTRTKTLVKEGTETACRIYGSMDVKKVTGNMHITTLGHGYMSREHTDHKLMNLSHVIDEFSFGPYFPRISQPLDNSFELSPEHFAIYQYFITVVPTLYVDAGRRKVSILPLIACSRVLAR